MPLTCPNCRFIQKSVLYICPECGVIRCNSANCLRLYNNIVAREGELCHFCGKGRWEKIVQFGNAPLDNKPAARTQYQ